MVRARRLERAGDLAGAIAVYREILATQEETAGAADLSLYNRIGDLYLRKRDRESAVAAFWHAVDDYESQQLYANAIALCKKILRNAPDYLDAHRRAARLLALSGLMAEARAHGFEYADRMRATGSLDAAIEALAELVELTGEADLRLRLADLLLEAECDREAARELVAVWRERTERGVDADELLERIRAIDPAVDPSVEAAAADDEPGRPDAAPARGPTAISGASGEASVEGREGETDVEALAGQLGEILRDLEGNERRRQALPIVDQLLQFQPLRVDLLQRKLDFAIALGDEEAAIEAYLALGEALEQRLDSFSLRSLTSSAPEGVTAAIRIERRAEASRDASGAERPRAEEGSGRRRG